MASRIDAFLQMLQRGQDSAVLRYSLGNEYLATNDAKNAVTHLRAAVQQDDGYSAAWKLLGKALQALGDDDAAAAAWADGIRVAESRGDRQAAKEMGVFLRRLEKQRGGKES